MDNYKLIGFNRKGCVSANIMLPLTSKQFSIPLHELVHSEIMDHLSNFEIREIYRKYYSAHDTSTAYEFEDRNEKSWLAYVYLCAALIGLCIASTITGVMPINFLNLTIPFAIFIYPLSYIISDILNEFYGLRLARKSINLAFASNAIFCAILFISSKATPLDNWELSSGYFDIADAIISVFLASSLAYIISEHINAHILYKLRVMTKSRYLFIRVFLSTIVSSILDSFIFITIAFHYLENNIMLSMIASQIMIKSFYAVFGVFPIYLSRYFFRKFLTKKG